MTSASAHPSDTWDFWIDRGGTFTDVIAVAPDGTLHPQKLLSENPGVYDDAVLEGIRQALNISSNQLIPAHRVGAITLGTTVATNALLERKGAATALAITAGLEDHIEIGTQARPDIFARRIVKPEMLYDRVIGVSERIRADGRVVLPLEEDALHAAFVAAKDAGIEAVAIVLLHAYAHPGHERRAAKIARRVGFAQISVSHDVSPLIRLVGRGDTTIADAYLTPILKRYIDRIAAGFAVAPDGALPRIAFMTSAGGLSAADYFRGRDAILSGPAGGIVGMAKTAEAAGFDHVIGFDMGGTSTDVSHYRGAFARTTETHIAGVRLNIPMLDIHTVAAGGGSILHFDGLRFQVGPDSAGAYPGPMCYGRDGPLTVTDANVCLGKIQAAHFPQVFGPGGTAPIDVAAVRRAFERLAHKIGDGRTADDTAAGFLRIAVENMANAIKTISVARGHDVTDYVMNCFGGAGGQHACAIADTLGMSRILIHPQSGLLSAYGMGLAPMTAARSVSLEQPLTAQSTQDLAGLIADLTIRTRTDVEAQLGAPKAAKLITTALVHLRYTGSDSTEGVVFEPDGDVLRSAFDAAHRRRFGFVSPEKSLEIARVDVATATDIATPSLQPSTVAMTSKAAEPTAQADVYIGGTHQSVAVFKRTTLAPGMTLTGPALVIEDHQTVVVEPGWQLIVTTHDNLLLTRAQPAQAHRAGTDADPVLLEVFNNLFAAIANQMGEALRNTARSVNIKERLDFSCAIFDANGRLVANAPHVPVHLGSMDQSVAAVLATRGRDTLKPGDVFMLNAPYNGGTHLPDITVVTPVFNAAGTEILFFTASRGHHEDVGGLTPGSMTPNATTLDEEGVVLDCVTLIDGGTFDEATVRRHFTAHRYPARQPEKNIADLKAQIAANARGAAALCDLVETSGLDVVHAYMAHVQDNAEELMRRLIATLDGGTFAITTDQGATIAVEISIDTNARSARVDFTGTSAQRGDNFNAPASVTQAAVLYAFRVLMDADLPINAGCLRPIDIIVPEGSMLNPRYPAAVVAGNVETSQVVTNCVFAALGALGSSQGTMNNLTFGDADRQYYETICSGAPAGPGFDGADAVQVHMTNTRLTDPEILELRYPVALEEFSIRRGSGGRGQWSAGDGTRRIIRFLEPMTGSILSGFRTIAPHGLNGGAPGATGRNVWLKADGGEDVLPSSAQFEAAAGDAVLIDTPTGGGVGVRDASKPKPA